MFFLLYTVINGCQLQLCNHHPHHLHHHHHHRHRHHQQQQQHQHQHHQQTDTNMSIRKPRIGVPLLRLSQSHKHDKHGRLMVGHAFQKGSRSPCCFGHTSSKFKRSQLVINPTIFIMCTSVQVTPTDHLPKRLVVLGVVHHLLRPNSEKDAICLRLTSLRPNLCRWLSPAGVVRIFSTAKWCLVRQRAEPYALTGPRTQARPCPKA